MAWLLQWHGLLWVLVTWGSPGCLWDEAPLGACGMRLSFVLVAWGSLGCLNWGHGCAASCPLTNIRVPLRALWQASHGVHGLCVHLPQLKPQLRCLFGRLRWSPNPNAPGFGTTGGGQSQIHLWRCCRPSWLPCACGGAFPQAWSRPAPCCHRKLLRRPGSCLRVRAFIMPTVLMCHATSQRLQQQLPLECSCRRAKVSTKQGAWSSLHACFKCVPLNCPRAMHMPKAEMHLLLRPQQKL